MVLEIKSSISPSWLIRKVIRQLRLTVRLQVNFPVARKQVGAPDRELLHSFDPRCVAEEADDRFDLTHLCGGQPGGVAVLDQPSQPFMDDASNLQDRRI